MRRLAVALLLVLSTITQPDPTHACEQVPRTSYNPTGWQGCEQWGEGTASTWHGPGAATNDCVWPWTDCATRTVTSLQTGISIIVTPTMFCGCFVNGVGPNGELPRLIDLDPSQLAALGLDPSGGLYPVRVTREGASSAVLPNTAMR